jgi:hypothetical protein
MADIIINEGTLATASVTGAATDADLDILVPEVSELYDEQLTTKMRACAAEENTTVTLQMHMLDKQGNNLDLTNHGIGGSSSSSESATAGTVQVRFREGALVTSTTYAVSATIVDADSGLVSCVVPSQVMSQPGIWLAEAGALDDSDNLLFVEKAFIYLQHNAWNNDTGMPGPPSVDDLRLTLRDSSSFESELLDNFAYGIVEMCRAAIRVVNFWNEQPPRIMAARYSTVTFPDRELWTTGCHLFLYEMAEEWYRRNHLQYGAGGVNTDDMNRHREYNQAWKERYQKFRQIVMHRKAEINMARGFSGYGGLYGARYRR